MYEPQEIGCDVDTSNHSRELSASVFSEQVTSFQERNNQDTTTATDSETVMNNRINSHLSDNIYKLQTNQQAGQEILKRRSDIVRSDQHDDTVDGVTVEVKETESQEPPSEEARMHDAVEWAQQNFQRFDRSRDGGLAKWELDLPKLTGSTSEQELEMLELLSENHDHFKHAHLDKGDWKGRKGITMKDLNVLDRHFEQREAFANAETETRGLAEQLMKGDKPLFDFLDRASNGKLDGRIGKGDLQRFMDDYEYLKQYGVDSGPYSQENVDTVSRLLETWDLDKFPGPGTRMRGIIDKGDIKDYIFNKKRYKYITVDKVVRAAGLG